MDGMLKKFNLEIHEGIEAVGDFSSSLWDGILTNELYGDDVDRNGIIERLGKRRYRLSRVLKEYDNVHDALEGQRKLFKKEETDDDVNSTWKRRCL